MLQKKITTKDMFWVVDTRGYRYVYADLCDAVHSVFRAKRHRHIEYKAGDFYPAGNTNEKEFILFCMGILDPSEWY